jgi:epoxide hydrolase-like predicted phosphatase
MFRAIFFDLGNVILPFDARILARALAPYSRLPEKEIVERIWQPEVGASFETGKITPKEFFAEVKKRCALKITYEKFMRAFNQIFREDSGVVELLSRIRNRYPIGLISNTNVAHMTHIKKNFSFVSHIDGMILSHEVGLRKPDPAIYWHALNKFGVRPEHAVFIDDMAENVKAATEIGITAIQFTSAEKLVENLTSLGVIS